MEEELRAYMIEEYRNLETDGERREFAEAFRFLMMAGEEEFQAYYSKAGICQRDFYQVADTLYSLNNFCMLSEFISQNRSILQNEMAEIVRIHGEPDFKTPYQFGKDTMIARIVQVITRYHRYEPQSISMVAERLEGYSKEVDRCHSLKVCSASGRNYQKVPQIQLQGKWLEKWGFSMGENVKVECYTDRLIISKAE